MELSTTVSVQDVKAVVVDSLDLHDRTEEIDAATPLGSLPELDSLAVVELVLELEDRFGIEVDGEDMTAEVFETLGTLTAFIESKLS
jgi:acyl carrier protein